jgi:hypothetical protein
MTRNGTEERQLDSTRLWAIFVLILLGAYSALFLELRGLPFGDLSHHLVRAHLLGDFLRNGTASEPYSFHAAITPPFLGDIILAQLLNYAAPRSAALLCMTALFLLFPLSLLFFLRQRGERRETILITALCAPFLATHYYFFSGAVHYCLGLSLSFLTLGLWERAALPSARDMWWRGVLFVLFLAAFIFTYLVHIAPTVLLSLILVMQVLYRYLCQRTTSKTLTFTLLAVIAVTVAYAAENFSLSSFASWHRRPFPEKLLAAGALFLRMDLAIDAALLFSLLLIAVLAVFLGTRSIRTNRWRNDPFELLLIITALVVAYLVLPSDSSSGLGWFDTSALSYLTVFILLLAFSWSSSVIRGRALLRVTCAALSTINFIYLLVYLLPLNRLQSLYLEALMHVPGQHTVLAVATRPPQGQLDTNLRAAELYMVEPGGTVASFNDFLSPSRNIPYFRRRQLLYAPSPLWYREKETIDWRRVRSTFDFMIIEKPYDQSRLSILRLTPIYENQAAAVFQLEH